MHMYVLVITVTFLWILSPKLIITQICISILTDRSFTYKQDIMWMLTDPVNDLTISWNSWSLQSKCSSIQTCMVIKLWSFSQSSAVAVTPELVLWAICSTSMRQQDNYILPYSTSTQSISPLYLHTTFNLHNLMIQKKIIIIVKLHVWHGEST